MVFNGEVYNYVELQNDLRKEGQEFSSREGDTAALLRSFDVWGFRETLQRSSGMLAAAVWDHETRRLHLARDRMGKKPLFYSQQAGLIAFASELTALRAVDALCLRPSIEGIQSYLAFGFVPCPTSIYEDVHKCPPGTLLTFEGGGLEETHTYWEMGSERTEAGTFGDHVDEIERLLDESVRLRLRADVPVGCFLSGGVDSGLIAASASRLRPGELRTFTVSVPDAQLDEGPAAASVARYLGTVHTKLRVDLSDPSRVLRIVQTLDEPIADASFVPTWMIAQRAREHVKVVLNGEGADELFGGYRRQLAAHWASQVDRLIPSALTRGIAWTLLSVLPTPQGFRTRYAFLHRVLRGLREQHRERYLAWSVDGFGGREVPIPAGYGELMELLEFSGSGPYEDSAANADLTFNMLNDMLVKVDRATMQHGLEARNPFLDERIVSFAQGLDRSHLFRGLNTKRLLRALAERRLPPAVATAPKRGFEVPLIAWMKGELLEVARDHCLEGRSGLREALGSRLLERLADDDLRIDPDRKARLLWSVLVFGEWASAC